MKKHTKKRIIMLLVLSVLLVNLGRINQVMAQTNQTKVNQTASGIELDNLQSSIDSFIEENKESCASVSLGVFQKDKTLSMTQYGYSDIENKIEVTPDTVYEWASVSKLVVWVSVMQLQEQGLIDLSEDIRNYLPKNFFKKLVYDDPITMTQLMNHQGGWQETTGEIEKKDLSKVKSLEESLKLYEPVQAFRPGEVTSYSNYGAALAGYIVERISGMDFVTYVHKNILEPLGMNHTSVGPDYADNSWVLEQRKKLHCYKMDGTDKIDLGSAMAYIQFYPAGSMCGTLEDFTTFAKALASDESKLFQKKETLDLIKQPTSYFGDSDIARNCHGLWTLQLATDVIGHLGNTRACSTELMFDSETGIGVTVLTNVREENVFIKGLVSLIFGQCNDQIDQESMTKQDISGSYYMSRLYVKGPLSFMKYIAMMNFPKAKNGVYELPEDQGTIKRISEHQYVMEEPGGYQNPLYFTEDDHGNKVLQMFAQDLIRVNSSTVLFRYISLGIFVVIVVVSFIILLVKMICAIRDKIKGKIKSKNPMIVTIAGTNLIIGISYVALIIQILFAGIMNNKVIMMECVISGIAVVAELVQLVLVGVKLYKQKMSKKEIAKVIVMSLTAIYMCWSAFFWQFINFWNI